MAGARTYGIDELAGLANVSRRTIRYYIQEGLLPAPLGLGRGRHYDQAHLDRLVRLRAFQEQGLSLSEIRARLEQPASRAARSAAAERDAEPALPRSLWRRIELAPGVELHVSSDVRLPAAGRLQELAAWCRTRLRSEEENDA